VALLKEAQDAAGRVARPEAKPEIPPTTVAVGAPGLVGNAPPPTDHPVPEEVRPGAEPKIPPTTVAAGAPGLVGNVPPPTDHPVPEEVRPGAEPKIPPTTVAVGGSVGNAPPPTDHPAPEEVRPEAEPKIPPTTVAVGGLVGNAAPAEEVETQEVERFKTPRTNGHRLPGTPHGPELPPSPTTPAADDVEPTQVVEPVATCGASQITAGGGEVSVPTTRPVATPVRHVGGVNDSLHASDYTLDKEQDAQVFTLKPDRKHKRPAEATSGAPKRFPDSVTRDPYDLTSPCSPSGFHGSHPQDAQHI